MMTASEIHFDHFDHDHFDHILASLLTRCTTFD